MLYGPLALYWEIDVSPPVGLEKNHLKFSNFHTIFVYLIQSERLTNLVEIGFHRWRRQTVVKCRGSVAVVSLSLPIDQSSQNLMGMLPY